MAFKFEKLEVWHLAVDLSGEIHELTLTFPKAEIFILSSQIKRAADSVALNIAEGSTGQSNAEFSKFLGYAIRSGTEVVTCLYLAKKRNLIGDDLFTQHYNSYDALIAKLQALRKVIKRQPSNG